MVVSTHMAPDVGAREPRVKDILDRFLADQLALVPTRYEPDDSTAPCGRISHRSRPP